LHFLADENLDFAVVRILRTAGHDVRALAEEATRTVDAEVIALALREGRILLTEDKDFGWLAFVAGARSSGVILVRFPGTARQSLGVAVLELVASHGEALRGSFTVIQPGHTRITPGPHRGVRGE
jgi:predicted nuclease of predicted toxin-antitoxin system